MGSRCPNGLFRHGEKIRWLQLHLSSRRQDSSFRGASHLSLSTEFVSSCQLWCGGRAGLSLPSGINTHSKQCRAQFVRLNLSGTTLSLRPIRNTRCLMQLSSSCLLEVIWARLLESDVLLPEGFGISSLRVRKFRGRFA